MNMSLSGTGVLAIGAIVAVGAAVAYYILYPTLLHVDKKLINNK